MTAPDPHSSNTGQNHIAKRAPSRHVDATRSAPGTSRVADQVRTELLTSLGTAKTNERRKLSLKVYFACIQIKAVDAEKVCRKLC